MINRAKGRVLIVDDEPLNLKILSNILSDESDLSVATSGEQALELIKRQPPDLVLLDIEMPDMDGYQVCRLLKEDPATSDIPIIFLTSKTTVEDEVKGFELGAVDYIAKPYNAVIVTARVRTHLELVRQRQITEALLGNILPNKIIQELKIYGEVKPQSFSNVSLLFSDIVDFTNIASTLTPEFLIRELSEIYSAFDEIVEQHDCQRIKTIGDAYFAASGMPESNPDHAHNMVIVGHSFVRYLVSRNKTAEISWEIRVGIHTGDVVAGIVGTKKYLYDVFGDAVNMTSRVEKASEPMRVNVSSAVYELVKNHYKCIPQGPVLLKGKGKKPLWLVVDPQHSSTV